MSEDPVPYNPDGLSAPAKPAQPTISDLYAEIAALRKERDALLLQIDAEANRAKAEAFDPKQPSIHDHNAVLIAHTGDGIMVRASRRGWAAHGSCDVPFVVTRDASPYSNYQAAAAQFARAGIRLGEPQLAPTETPATVPTPSTPA